PVKEVTFANALRSILRQDPNVILVGEIRDTETAEIAFRASMTGHLVLSTLHTNNSIATIARLFDMGLEPYLVSSSLLLIIAQRLVRLNCPYCKVEYTPDAHMLDKFKVYIEQFGIKQFFKSKGCKKCDFSGFQGRAAIFELLKISEKMKSLIARSAPEDELLKESIACGTKLLAMSGMRKIAGGLTTMEEVAKVADVLEQSPAEKQAAPKERDKAKVLIADDEADIRASMQRRLTVSGYDVVTASNGGEAVERAFREKPDLILMDLNMPGMDGMEAVKVLRSKLETAAIPVIMLTAVTAKESEITAFDIGADDYLTKPFDFDKLHARIKMLLKKKWKWTASV
ncbi:MAG: ATPase, T2SS/T4P/T4SS family, partial [Candidatus Omnitrophica bacterium]|nr:ATPase, T2SS/T4P/T4SS family [Candidatus Omnitrophota bacterium]